MAGLGAKLFTDGSVLNAEQVNGYLMDQSIMRFATTAARDAAFGGVGEPTLAEGMTAYIDADNSLYIYDGANWVKSVSASQPTGLQLITSGTLSDTTNFEGCFSADFTNYKIVISKVQSAAGFISLRMLSGSTPLTTVSYLYALSNINNTGTTSSDTGTGSVGVLGYVFQSTTNGSFGASWDIFNPFGTGFTMLNGQTTTYYTVGPLFASSAGMIGVNSTSSYDGFQILKGSGTATITAGNVDVYAYRN